MKIYLAGKVGLNDWRNGIVEGLRSECADLFSDPLRPWRTLHRSIAGRHHYTGPYFISCDHGCFHGESSHGYGANPIPDPEQGIPVCIETCAYGFNSDCATTHGYNDFDQEFRRHVVDQCLTAINNSDVVFAWLDDLTAFGSIFEIGYAIGRGVPVVTVFDHGKLGEWRKVHANDPLWFIGESVDYARSADVVGYEGIADDIKEAFEFFLKHINRHEDEEVRRAKIRSPIELRFYDRIKFLVNGLEPQWEIPVDGHRYKADFALPSKKIAIELDGHDYHKTKEQRTNDARRERDLQKAGWKVIRFAGTEIYKSLDKCCEDTLNLIGGA